MTKNRSKVLWFVLCVLASIGMLRLFSIDVWNYYHVVLFVLCVSVWVWCLHYFANRK